MAFDPSKPADNSPLSAAEMRTQLTSLNTDIQSRVTQPQLSNAETNAVNTAIANTLPQTSANTNTVSTLNQSADSSYNQSQMQDVINKLDEFINAARRP